MYAKLLADLIILETSAKEIVDDDSGLVKKQK